MTVVTRRAMAARTVVVVVVSGTGAVATAVAGLAGLVTGGRPAARRRGYRGLVRTLERLGPTFVKFGQLASTRRDTMPAALADALATLHDAVQPMPDEQAAAVIRRAAVPGLVRFATAPEASGSIAGVYRGELADGRVVALKVKRPGIAARMHTDLALMRAATRLLQRLPRLRGMPLADLVGYVGAAIVGQLDFVREAANAQRLRECLADVPRIVVPEVHPELSSADCLVFGFLEGLDGGTPAGLTGEQRRVLAGRVLRAVHTMVFVHGFVHCDLHPGNVYLTRDGHAVVLDAGYCVQLTDRVRELIAGFFAALATGDGRRCGEIVLAAAVHPERADRAAFVAGMTAAVARLAGPGVEFDMRVFGEAVFALQQRHGIYAASEFAFPLMSLNVVDGTLRGFSGEVDMRQVGAGQP
ncbi:ABC1 kinase family protein [Symbioplanes lichenis]|uniref:ABC1 kinase family protein n=1 Tax=Symbioplanes lichenis TaxID=1629072 RepID=UPI002739C2F3|nr:AarF/ABC1/UbiB kinase family protein [Actinoplanes lichenis]